jgi:hypothetical protein
MVGRTFGVACVVTARRGSVHVGLEVEKLPKPVSLIEGCGTWEGKGVSAFGR